jgi:hypothetical protein
MMSGWRTLLRAGIILWTMATSEWGVKSSIWPQGKYAKTLTDLSFLVLMLDNGFSVGRTADGPGLSYHMQKNNALRGEESTASLRSNHRASMGEYWHHGAIGRISRRGVTLL